MKPYHQAKRTSKPRLRNWQSLCYQLYSSQAQTLMDMALMKTEPTDKNDRRSI